MAKRASEIYLTDQNWDKEQPEEEAGVFTVASDNVLQNRAIIKAKRRYNANNGETGSGAFKSFTGLTGSISEAKVDNVSSFSFCMPLKSQSNNAQKSVRMSALNKQLMEFLSGHISNDPSCNLVPVFDDYCTHVSDISAKCGSQVETQPGTLGAAVGASPASASAVPLSELFKKTSSSWDCSTCLVNNKNESSVCIACAAPRPAQNTSEQSSTVSAADSSKKPGEHADGGPVPLSQLFQKSSDTWECPTCMITNKNVDTTCAACSCPKPTTGDDASTCTVQSTKASAISLLPSGGFTFSFGSGQTSSTSFTGFSFKPPVTCTVASFSFGSSLTSTLTTAVSADSGQPSASTGFSFSKPLQLGGASAGTFSFANTSGFSFKPAQPSVSENKGEDDAEYVPQKPESVKHVEEGSFYSVRCKLFCKVGDSWKDRGTGYLFLKPCGDRTQLLIRADTATGNILLNILLTSGIPVSRQGANNVSLVCVPTTAQSSGDESRSETPACMLIRVKTSEMADELFSNISKYKDV